MTLPPIPTPDQPIQPIQLPTAKAPRQRLPQSTQTWLKVYLWTGFVAFVLSIFVSPGFLALTFGVVFLMIFHMLFVTCLMTWRRNNAGNGRRRA